MVSGMDFRMTNCPWCANRSRPMEDCTSCPKYLRHEHKRDTDITMETLCAVCINRNNPDLEVFCKTNRFHQEGSGEEFECYNFCIAGDAPR